jgi:hypothetical protein
MLFFAMGHSLKYEKATKAGHFFSLIAFYHFQEENTTLSPLTLIFFVIIKFSAFTELS